MIFLPYIKTSHGFQGLLMYYPNIRDYPVISDMKWMQQLINALISHTAIERPHENHPEITSLGEDICKVTEHDLRNIIKTVHTSYPIKVGIFNYLVY